MAKKRSSSSREKKPSPKEKKSLLLFQDIFKEKTNIDLISKLSESKIDLKEVFTGLNNLDRLLIAGHDKPEEVKIINNDKKKIINNFLESLYIILHTSDLEEADKNALQELVEKIKTFSPDSDSIEEEVKAKAESAKFIEGHPLENVKPGDTFILNEKAGLVAKVLKIKPGTTVLIKVISVDDKKIIVESNGVKRRFDLAVLHNLSSESFIAESDELSEDEVGYKVEYDEEDNDYVITLEDGSIEVYETKEEVQDRIKELKTK